MIKWMKNLNRTIDMQQQEYQWKLNIKFITNIIKNWYEIFYHWCTIPILIAKIDN